LVVSAAVAEVSISRVATAAVAEVEVEVELSRRQQPIRIPADG